MGQGEEGDWVSERASGWMERRTDNPEEGVVSECNFKLLNGVRRAGGSHFEELCVLLDLQLVETNYIYESASGAVLGKFEGG